MLEIVAGLVLAYFAWEDYKKGTTETREWFVLLCVAAVLVFLFGNLTESLVIGSLFLMVMLGFQIIKVTYPGDTIVIPLIAFIYPNFLLTWIALTIGFILSAFSKKKKIPYLPNYFIGWVLAFLIVLVVQV